MSQVVPAVSCSLPSLQVSSSLHHCISRPQLSLPSSVVSLVSSALQQSISLPLSLQSLSSLQRSLSVYHTKSKHGPCSLPCFYRSLEFYLTAFQVSSGSCRLHCLQRTPAIYVTVLHVHSCPYSLLQSSLSLQVSIG